MRHDPHFQRPAPGAACHALPRECARCSHVTSTMCRMVGDRTVPALRKHHLEKGATLERSPRGGVVGVLKRGYLLQERSLPDGRRTVMGLSVPGDVVGEPVETGSATAFTAATPVEICLWETEEVHRLMETDSAFLRQLMGEMDALHARQLDMLWQRGALKSHERVVAFLLHAAAIMPSAPAPGGGLVVTIELSRRDWADLTGTSIESISREMSRLARLGLVTQLGRGRYHLHDPEGLADLVGIDADGFVCRASPENPGPRVGGPHRAVARGGA